MIASILILAALNANPRFDASADSLSGWRLSGAARFMKDAEGVPYVLAEGGSAKSDLFPVKGGSTISVTFRAAPPRYVPRPAYPWAAVSFFDSKEAAAAKGAQWAFVRPKLEVRGKGVVGRTETYPVPPTAKWCRLTVRGGSIYTCEATEVK